MIEQRFGAQVRGEALDGLLRETFDAAVREHDLRVVGSPRIDKGDEGEFSFVATVEVVPDFGDIDVSKLTVVRHTAEITEADIDQMIENLQNQRRTWAPVSRGAQEGDRSRWKPGRRPAKSACRPRAPRRARSFSARA